MIVKRKMNVRCIERESPEEIKYEKKMNVACVIAGGC
jgi:hypothetical protein